MLKNIRLHVDKDEDKQKKIEEIASEPLAAIRRNNTNAFQRNMPSVLPFVKNLHSQNISIFCNKFGEYNIVDYGLGRTFYGLYPNDEIRTQFNQFQKSAAYVPLAADESEAKTSHARTVLPNKLCELPRKQLIDNNEPMPVEADCAVVLGIGLGHHIRWLIEEHRVKHLIIFEPEIQYFKCSFMTLDWRLVLEMAKEKGISIYLLLGKDGRDLINNIQELDSHFTIDGFYIYQHYHHPVFTSVYSQCVENTWDRLEKQGLSFGLEEKYNEYSPTWTPPISISQLRDVDTSDKKFVKNLNTLRVFFPEIYEEFKEYKPDLWMPVIMKNDEINLVKMDTLTNWHGSEPKNECLEHYNNFSEQPNKDGLILGYNGRKLAHYIHYQFVKETEELLKNIEEESGALPETIKSIILFGLGTGYQLEHLNEKHKMELLFICEPNRDFFYASLFAIDWHKIIKTAHSADARIYLNIGDDGSHLMRDLLNQFYSIGPYVLNHTFFYQSYHNSVLAGAIAQLREQLQIVISMGEYFDHAYYGIGQTKDSLLKNHPYLRATPSKYLSGFDKDVPIFLVGNGPSLDHSIEYIQEWQDKAILVSCGTCLQVLWKNGIRPDFHAEIEQNRATFDWANMIGDSEFVANTDLLSCNGIHPDTCELYRDIYIAFKEGESSTVSAFEVLGQENYEALKYAFPTVGNFAFNLFASLGFENIYLIGMDFGFVDRAHHHSKSSEYYKESGEESFDYEEFNITSLVVPGNFRKTVNTKHEFKVAKEILEQTLVNHPKKLNVFNCSDGAKINGTFPLVLDNILLTVTPEQKQESLHNVKTKAFRRFDSEKYLTLFETKYSHNQLMKDLEKCQTLISDMPDSVEYADKLMNAQKDFLFDTYIGGNSLLFYFLYGTMNYTNAVLSKLLYSSQDDAVATERFNKGLAMWRGYFAQIKDILELDSYQFDHSQSFIKEAYKIKHEKRFAAGKKILFSSDSLAFQKSVQFILEQPYDKQWQAAEITYRTLGTGATPAPVDIAIYYLDVTVTGNVKEAVTALLQDKDSRLGSQHNLVVCNVLLPPSVLQNLRGSNVTLMCHPNNYGGTGSCLSSTFWVAARACRLLFDSWNFDFIVPKIAVKEEFDITQLPTLDLAGYNLKQTYTFSQCIAGIIKARAETPSLCFNERLTPTSNQITGEQIVFRDLPEEKFLDLQEPYYRLPDTKGLSSNEAERLKFKKITPV